MSEREPDLLFKDMLDSAEKIIRYTSKHTKEDFLDDQKTIDAVIRNFEIIGEAANRLPEASKTKNPKFRMEQVKRF